jgi:CubicO group peptidase (beta-lactamase class C family)
LKDITSRKKYASLEEAVNDLPKKEIQSNPGTEFRFSNYGFEIAGRIVEIVSKKKFEMLIKQKLFNPLSMRQTNFNTLDGSAPSPSVGAVSSANDYMQFLKMLLNGGVLNGNRVLSENAVKELRSMQTKEEQIKYSPKAAEGMPYALGSWVVETKDGEASSLTTTGVFGSIATVDWCRGYVHLLLVKTLQSEQKKDAYLQMKEAIDDRLRSKCK